MKIAIAGAGAMDSQVGLMLHQSENGVLLIDRWPVHIEAICANGLIADFNGKEVVAKLPIYSSEEIIEGNEHVDLIVVLTKANQLDDMFRSIQSIITDNTYALRLLSGLGHEDILEKYVLRKSILFGITMWTVGLAGPGEVTLLGDGEVELENLEPEGGASTKKVMEVFQEAKLNPIYSHNIRYSVWRKACVNETLNDLCTILGCNIAELGAQKTAESMVRTIISEFASIAAKKGVILDQEEVYQHIAFTYDPDDIELYYPSMYQDLIENYCLTEIDYINGAVWRKGQKYDIATSYCAFLTQLVHAKEGILGTE